MKCSEEYKVVEHVTGEAELKKILAGSRVSSLLMSQITLLAEPVHCNQVTQGEL